MNFRLPSFGVDTGPHVGVIGAARLAARAPWKEQRQPWWRT